MFNFLKSAGQGFANFEQKLQSNTLNALGNVGKGVFNNTIGAAIQPPSPPQPQQQQPFQLNTQKPTFANNLPAQQTQLPKPQPAPIASSGGGLTGSSIQSQPIANSALVGGSMGTGPNQGYLYTGQNQQSQSQQNQGSNPQDPYGVLSRLTALYGAIAQQSVPGQTEQDLINQINQYTNTLNNTNPNQYLKDNPSLQGGGITQGQLERTTEQASLPITQALNNLILGKSVLANQRTNQLTALTTGAQGLSNIFGLTRPEFSLGTGITGQPFVFNQRTGQVQGLGGGQAGALPAFLGGQGGQGGFSAGGTNAQGQPTSINLGGLDVPVDYNNGGNAYINASRLSDPQKKIAQLYAAQTGIPVLTTEEVNKVRSVDITQQNLNSMSDTISKILQPGLFGRLVTGNLNKISDFLQTNADISSFNTYRDTAINAIQALAGGSGGGFRLNQAEIDTATRNLPTISDNLETAQAKLQKMNSFLQRWNDEIFQNQNQQNQQSSGSSNTDTFSNGW